MIWILAAIIIILLFILAIVYNYDHVTKILEFISIGIFFLGATFCLEATDVDWLDSRNEIEWKAPSISQQTDMVVSIKMPSDEDQKISIYTVEKSSGKLVQKEYAAQNVKVFINPSYAGRMETIKYTGIVKSHAWWIYLQRGIKEKSVCSVYVPENKIT